EASRSPRRHPARETGHPQDRSRRQSRGARGRLDRAGRRLRARPRLPARADQPLPRLRRPRRPHPRLPPARHHDRPLLRVPRHRRNRLGDPHMTALPEPPAAPAAGQATSPLTDAVLRAAGRDAIHQASYRDDSPPPVRAPAPPGPQPGRPPMSAKAGAASVRVLSASVLTATGGGAATAVLWAPGHANPAVVACVFGAPTALVLALGRLARKARPEPEVHQH